MLDRAVHTLPRSTTTVESTMVIKAPKAASAAECKTLEQLPNIGPSLAADLRLIGITEPRQLRGKDAFVLYQKLCAATGQRPSTVTVQDGLTALEICEAEEKSLKTGTIVSV